MKKILDWVNGKLPNFEEIGPAKPTAVEDAEFKKASLTVAPVIWLLGKTGSGKSSIVAAITGASNVEVGSGFSSCTKNSAIYDFPLDQPLIRFLDTRGFGEAGYNPAEDMCINEGNAHLIIAVMKASDPKQEELIRVLTRVRKTHSDWPILVVQTCLHELYDSFDDNHPESYQYLGNAQDDNLSAIPKKLRNSLKFQRDLLEKLPGEKVKFVQIDFTKKDEGFIPHNFGFDALTDGILEVAPEAIKLLALEYLKDIHKDELDKLAAKANPTILYFAATAAGVGAIPIIGIVSVPSAQGAMLWRLASLYEVEWNWKSVSSLTSMLGTSAVIRQLVMQSIRQLTKSLPWLIPIAGAQDYAVTYALGKASCVYFTALKDRREPEAEAIQEAFKKGLMQAFNLNVKAESI